MRFSAIARSSLRRLRHPAAWGVILGFEVVWVAADVLSRGSFDNLAAWEFYVPALFLLGQLALAAAPWQWTNDERPTASLIRGSLQALLWDSAWVILFLWGVKDVVHPPARQEAVALIQPQPHDPPRKAPRPPEPHLPSEQGPPIFPNDGQARPADEPPPQGDEERRPPREADHRPPRETEDRQLRPPRPEPTAPRPALSAQSSPQAASRPSPPPGLRQEMKLLCLNLPFALVLGWFLAGKERAESSEEELRKKERQAQNIALQAQLHPHALYNVLAGLSELVHEDPDATEKAIIELVEMLRMLTQQARAPRLPLSQERALVRHYLSIEAIRLGDRLQVQWEWPAWADELLMPPLLLQPLVENAIKHGIAAHPQGGILRIAIQGTSGHPVLRVANTGNPLDPRHPSGTGLGNLRERLALLPSKATLHLFTSQEWTIAELRFVG